MSRPARLVNKRATPEEQAVLDRANTQARAMLKAAGRKAIIDEYWEELDRILSELMADWSGFSIEEWPEDNDAGRVLDWGELRGQAQGVAYCIAVMTQPYGDRSVDAVREEAMRRYQAAERQATKPKRKVRVK
jgi:hypothetical protein